MIPWFQRWPSCLARERRGKVGGFEPPARQHDSDVARHQRRRCRHVGAAGEGDVELDRGLRPHRDAVADITHVDATILGGGAGVEEGKFQKPFACPGSAEWDAHDAPLAGSVERDRRNAAVIEEDFEAAAGFVGTDIVHDEHQLVRGDVGALRQRHEQVTAAAEIGEAKPIAESDITERDRGQERTRTRLYWLACDLHLGRLAARAVGQAGRFGKVLGAFRGLGFGLSDEGECNTEIRNRTRGH